MKSDNKTAGLGILTAFAASLCCITPLLTAIAGAGSFVAKFVWLAPLRPYLTIVTICAIAFAWFTQWKTAQTSAADCCTPNKKPSFFQGKTFLSLATLLAALMLTLPYYTHIFYPAKGQTQAVSSSPIRTITFKIDGMTCGGCVVHITQEIKQLEGIVHVKTSYEKGNAIVSFDSTAVDVVAIVKAIDETGYTVVQHAIEK